MTKLVLLLWTLLCASNATAATISHSRLDNGSELIEITGDIKLGDDSAFKKLAIQFDKAVLGLSSNGGALAPALEIGTTLHIRGFDTAVVAGKQCASACALIWAAGANRYLVKGGRVGFHASYVEDNGKVIETGLGNALVGRYLTQLGLSERAIVFATVSHPDSIAWLEQERDALISGFSFDFSIPKVDESRAKLVASPASAKPSTSYRNVGAWSIFRNKDNCGATATFGANNILSLNYFAETNSINVGISYADGTSLREGDKKSISIILERQDGTYDDGWKSVDFTVYFVGKVPTLFVSLKAPAFTDIRDAKRLGFFYNNKPIFVYNLVGIKDALSEVATCSFNVNNLNPRDVFAN